MKWSRQKPSSLITRIFSKFKRNSSSKTAKLNSSTVLDFPSPNSSFYREGRFYSMDEDDSYWRISFGADDRIQPRRSTGGINPLSDNDIENHMFSKADAEAPRRNFTEMVSDIKKMRESRGKQQRLNKDELERKVDMYNGGRDRQIPIPIESKDSRKPTKNPKLGHECRDERKQLRDIKVKTGETRVRRTKEKSRAVKAYSPRTECKIRAIEEMRKAKTKAKKKEPVVDVNTVFDSFAVVKSSLDPHRDFKDSMVEMIREKGIGHPDDLEELLACYLTLNCDEYHDLIISVFQQVWIELNKKCVDP